MIDKNDFADMKKILEKEEDIRDSIAEKAREILRLSKQIIYSLHRDDIPNADNLYKKMLQEMKNLEKVAIPKLKEGLYGAALQEYVEAACYYEFVKNKKIPTHKDLDVPFEEYLLGICDLTGELERRAVFLTLKEKYADVQEIKGIVDDIHFEFLKFDLRNGELRKKADSIKWNLKRIDEILYDLKIKGKI
jgi:predicted translin family RNA/ssDNA-binding protein